MKSPAIFLLLILLLLPACDYQDTTHDSAEISALSAQQTIPGYAQPMHRAIPVYNDSRLRAAFGSAVISPTLENHPCTWYMAGSSSNKIADYVHDDLEARGLLVAYKDEYFFLVSLDVVGFLLPDAQKVMDELAGYGFSRDRIIISSTHTHEGPDTIGIWGDPLSLTCGRCDPYMDFLVRTISRMARNLANRLQPVTVTGAATIMNEPGAMHSNLQNDSRYPYVYNDYVTSLRFETDYGTTLGTLVNWQTHPECNMRSHVYSSDFPHWTRKKMEEHFGGTSVYVSGTVGGLMTPLHIDVPERTETGEVVYEADGQTPAFILTNGEIKAWSLGYVLAEWAIDALENQPETIFDDLEITTQAIDFPVVSPFIIGAMLLGLVPDVDTIWDPAKCGLFGCFRQSIHLIRLGQVYMISLPGEAFPEMAVGRDESTYDWGSEWGSHTYPEIVGYREILEPGALVVDIGLANNEMGYFVPKEDFEYPDHPNQYEEIYFFSLQTEELVRNTVADLILKNGQ